MVYEPFFGLQDKPFILQAQPDRVYLSSRHAMAVSLLDYGLESGAGVTVLTGDTGTGKTTVLGHWVSRLGDEIIVGSLASPPPAPGELTAWILHAFGQEHRGLDAVEMHERLVRFLLDRYAEAKDTVLVIDEAQNLRAEQLEELRLLTNYNVGTDRVLALVLAGQTQLRGRLLRPELDPFAQRVSIDYHLEALDQSETREYVAHRIRAVSGDPAIFTEPAIRLIHKASGGVPRVVNAICEAALVHAFATQTRSVDAELIVAVCKAKAADSLLRGLLHRRLGRSAAG